ncbi:MAG: DNA repair protein RecO, partial [Deltaproteobacteria bacterium]|nr:DNA repair protein RecO [Deltaproteobacteria bacterium]
MRTLRTEALILRSVDFGESDRIVHLLTPHTGRLTAIAKGAKRSVKRFGGTLDFFNHLRVQLVMPRTTQMARLEQTRLLRTFEGLRTRPRSFALGCYLLELLDRLAPEGGAPHDLEQLFGFALETLGTLEHSEPDPRLRILLELCTLDALGLRPELRRCVRCGEEVAGPRVGFSVPDGGPVCTKCQAEGPGGTDLLPIHLGTLRALEHGVRLGLERADRLALSPAALEEARRVVGRFERFHVGVELRSQRFMEQVLQERPPPPPRSEQG